MLAHNAYVLRGYDPQPPSPGYPAGTGAPEADEAGASHGTYIVRLEGVATELADGFVDAVSTAGAAAVVQPRGDSGARLDLFASLPQVEVLRSQLLAAAPGLSRLAEEVVAALQAYHRLEFRLRCGARTLECGRRPLVMGVINCTPDSFYGGSIALGDAALRRAERMVARGVDIVDVGGESTRPGSQSIDAAEEMRRVVPVVRLLNRRLRVPISIDTTKSVVARAAIDAGATIVNDTSGFSADERLGSVLAAAGVPVTLILMHTRGPSQRMYAQAEYGDVVGEVIAELRAAVGRATQAGIPLDSIVVDPGIGFAKRAEHSLVILHNLAAFRSLGRPLLVGVSRKSFIGAVLDLPAEERLDGTAAAVAAAVLQGAHILRVHDVGAMRRAADMAAAIRCEGRGWIC